MDICGSPSCAAISTILLICRGMSAVASSRPKRLGLALAAIARHFDLGETYIGLLSCDHVVSRQRLKQPSEISAVALVHSEFHSSHDRRVIST